jgi:hypothetical protein
VTFTQSILLHSYQDEFEVERERSTRMPAETGILLVKCADGTEHKGKEQTKYRLRDGQTAPHDQMLEARDIQCYKILIKLYDPGCLWSVNESNAEGDGILLGDKEVRAQAGARLVDELSEIANAVLGNKFLIGLLSELGVSLSRFMEYNGCSDRGFEHAGCVKKILIDGVNKNPDMKRQRAAKVADVYNLLQSQNHYYIMLYEFAEELFKKQSTVSSVTDTLT